MVLPLRALRVLGGEAFHDFTATSNHEGHEGTQRECASVFFSFVRFVFFVVKPFCSGLMTCNIGVPA